MAIQIFDDFRKEYWFHVSNQNEMMPFGQIKKSIDSDLLYETARKISQGGNDLETLKQLISENPDVIDTLRTLVGVTDKRMYLELSYLFNKQLEDGSHDTNILGESVYDLKKHAVSYFKNRIKQNKSGKDEIIDGIAGFLVDRGVSSVLKIFSKMSRDEVGDLVDKLLLPNEIQQEETKRRGHGAEQALASLLHELGVLFLPDKRHENPMSQDDPNVDKTTFVIAPRDPNTTWSMDLIVTQAGEPRILIQGLIHSSDPGQYGVNKSGETVLVKMALSEHNKTVADTKELWGLVDGVGFIENPDNTVFKMIQHFDTFVQLKSLYKAALRLHKLGIVKIEAIRFDMTFYSQQEADEMFELYGSDDILKITDNRELKGKEVKAGKAWLYI